MAEQIPKAATVSPRPPLARRVLQSETVRRIFTIAVLLGSMITMLWCIATYDR